MGIEIRLGDADLLGLCRGGALGGADVGPPLEQFRRNAQRCFGRRGRDRPHIHAAAQVGGRKALQGAKLVLALPQADFQGRDRGLGRRQSALLLINVQSVDRPGGEAGLHDIERLALQFRIRLGQLDPLLGLPHRDVVLCRVGQQSHEHGIVIFHRPFQLRIGALHLAAIRSPKVQLPGQVEAHVPIVAQREGGTARAGITAGDVLILREELALSDGKLVAGLKDPRTVFLQVDVLARGNVRSSRRARVVERGPPAAQVGGVAADA